MKTLTINVDEQLYEILSHRSNYQLIQMLKSSIRREEKAKKPPISEISLDKKSKENNALERSKRKSQILAFSGCWEDEEEDYFTTEAIISRRQASTRDRHL